MPAHQRLRVEIQGAVQGVGFRPFVYRLATELNLRGWVSNGVQGVFVEAEGPRPDLDRLLDRLSREAPPRAQIVSLDTTWLDPAGYADFQIRHSDARGVKSVLVLPDIATCPQCLAEILDPGDRRYRYPFTNCTNCGPRFTIVQDLPYDRPNTTMHSFAMCPACRAEYADPLDRRFHAQPNACPRCGPQLALYQPSPAGGESQAGAGTVSPGENWPAHAGDWQLVAARDPALRSAAAALAAGRIVAVKGLGGFHLMVDARDPEAVARLRERKSRRDKPLALMVRDLEQARRLCRFSTRAEALLTAPEAPIVLLPGQPDSPVAAAVAPHNPNLGIMLPATPLHHLLLRETGFPLVATSGNLSDEPICTDEWEAMQRLGHIADAFLVHDRPIVRHIDDSIVWMVQDQPQLLRRARGYAPLPIRLARPLPTVLAVGAHLKNTVALNVGRQVFISQHIGDLETVQSLAAFQRVIADFLRLYEAAPVAIAHDMHPDYLSTRWARRQPLETGSRPGLDSPLPAPDGSIPLIPVQHHHAHLASCLAEHGVEGRALGVIWDGTGYGLDGAIWGGEFLLGDAAGFARVAHLRPFRLPGGDAAVKEPRRVALALLWELYGDAVLDREDLDPVRALSPAQRRLLARMLARGVNAPLTTSAGRLFDGVAALLGIHQQVTFEGQAAMALEFSAACPEPGRGEAGAYPLPMRPASPPDHPCLVLDWQPLLEAILADLRQATPVGIMTARFHAGLIAAIGSVARAVGEERVVLSGGCFQNRLLAEGAARHLAAAGFQVLMHRQVPPNDGGISLGQLAVAAAQLQST